MIAEVTRDKALCATNRNDFQESVVPSTSYPSVNTQQAAILPMLQSLLVNRTGTAIAQGSP